MLLTELRRTEKCYKKELEILQKTDKPLVLVGAGCTSDFIVNQFAKHGIYPDAFADNDKKKQGTIVANLPVVSVEDLIRQFPKAYIYVTTQMYYGQLKRQLINCGVQEKQILTTDLIFQFPWECSPISFFEEHENELESFYDALADDKSKTVFKNRLKFLVSRERRLMVEVHDNNQYFDTELMKEYGIFESNVNFIDCGTFIGDTIEEFIRQSGGNYKKIWGFEPDQYLNYKARERLKGYRNINLVKKGTGNLDGSVKVNSSLGLMKSIENKYNNDLKEEDKFEICKLDSYFQKIDLGSCYVKMDIEGAEVSTILGMKNIIKRFQPMMAVSVYHKLDDLPRIPELISNLGGGGDYKFYLRHYSDNQTETVLYALVEK